MDSLLDEIAPEQFNEWFAEHQIEPWGDDWRQATMIAAAVINLSWIVAATGGAKINAEDFIEPQDLMPNADDSQQDSRKRLTAAQSEALARERYAPRRE